jgi:hypothetical protein
MATREPFGEGVPFGDVRATRRDATRRDARRRRGRARRNCVESWNSEDGY